MLMALTRLSDVNERLRVRFSFLDSYFAKVWIFFLYVFVQQEENVTNSISIPIVHSSLQSDCVENNRNFERVMLPSGRKSLGECFQLIATALKLSIFTFRYSNYCSCLQ